MTIHHLYFVVIYPTQAPHFLSMAPKVCSVDSTRAGVAACDF